MSIKHIPLHNRPREKLSELGVKNLTDKELVAIILRSGTSKVDVLNIAASLLRKVSLKDISQMNVQDLQKTGGTQPEQILLHVHHLAAKKQEHFMCLYVNARFNLLKKSTISIGTIDTSLAHPREIFRPAIEMGASYIIVAHNHPSGDPQPSEADLLLTARVVEAGEIIGIRLLDHLIVATNGWVSLKKLEMM
jgi:DNA repair protein RadC